MTDHFAFSAPFESLLSASFLRVSLTGIAKRIKIFCGNFFRWDALVSPPHAKAIVTCRNKVFCIVDNFVLSIFVELLEK